MKINVKNCSNCPFCISEYNEFSVGYDTVDYCNLARFFNLKEYMIDVYDSFENESVCDYCDNLELGDVYNKEMCSCDELNKPKEKPNWCPLVNEDIVISI